MIGSGSIIMRKSPLSPSRTSFLLPAVLLLVSLFGLAAGSSLFKSPVVEEGSFLARGWAAWRTGHTPGASHPPLMNLVSGLGVLLEPGLPDPRTLNGWEEDDAETFSDDLLWRRGVDVQRIVFLARLPIIWLGMLLGAVVWRWAWDVYGPWSAVLAQGLYAFSPNILAYTQLATPDLGVAAFYIVALYSWGRFLHRQRRYWLIISGIALGSALASGYTALLLIPTLVLMTLWYTWRRGPLIINNNQLWVILSTWPLGRLWTGLAALLLVGAIGLGVLRTAYLFSPPPFAYWDGALHVFTLSARQGTYMLERFSQEGWWYYLPFVLAVKVPVHTWLLLTAAFVLAVGHHMAGQEWEIAFPALLYFPGVMLLAPSDGGIGHLLLLLPLLFLFAARMLSGPLRVGWLRSSVAWVSVAVAMTISLWAFPNYLPFFNMVVGGPSNGHHLLVDSNSDRGQDLPGLVQYLEVRGAGKIYLSYFGQADPAYYVIDYSVLPPDPDHVDFYPLNPSPGLYAISVSNLVGARLDDPDTFGYFRARAPVARIGYSIYVYEVPPASEKPPTWFAQCAVSDPLSSAWLVPFSVREEAVLQMTGLPDLRMIYYDCLQGLPFPDGPGWLVVPTGVEPPVDLGGPSYLARYPDGSPHYRVWMFSQAPAWPESSVEFPAVSLPLPIAGYIELLGYQVSAAVALPGDTLTLTTWWRVREPIQPPVSFFTHLVATDGTLVHASDGLGVPAEYWQPGMVIVQQHHLQIGDEIPPGSYTLAVGLYSLSTGERFPVSRSGERVIDRIVLRSLQIQATER